MEPLEYTMIIFAMMLANTGKASVAADAAFMGGCLTPWAKAHGYFLRPLRGGISFGSGFAE